MHAKHALYQLSYNPDTILLTVRQSNLQIQSHFYDIQGQLLDHRNADNIICYMNK